MADEQDVKPVASPNPEAEAGPDDLASLWGSPKPAQEPTPVKGPDVASKVPPAFGKVDAQEDEKSEQPKKVEKNVIEGEVVEEPQPPPPPHDNGGHDDMLPEPETFADRLEEILSEMHITPRHIAFGAGCLILLVLGVYFGIKGVSWYFGQPKDEKPKTSISSSESKKEKTPRVEIPQEQNDFSLTAYNTGLRTAILFGRPYLLPTSYFTLGDTILSTLLGEGKDSKSRLNYYIMLLKRMQNAFATDVQAMLNAATDRRSVLQNHLARLRKVNEEGVKASSNIDDELLRYQPMLDDVTKSSEDLQKSYFAEINNLNPQAETYLDQFIEKAKQLAGMKARYRSLQSLQKMYGQAMPRMAARIRDIDLNQEPLISGLKVYDVKGSDLQLILADPGASVSERTSAIPLLNPTNISGNSGASGSVMVPTNGAKAGNWDYITTPPPPPPWVQKRNAAKRNL